MKIVYNISDQTTVIGDKPETIEKGETLSLTLQANSGFKFEPVPLVAIRTSSFQYINTNFEVDSTGKNATISYQIPANASTCTVKAFTVESADPEPETVNVTNNLSNCTSSVNNGTVNKGEEITITLTANNGFSFSGVAPTVDYETTGTPSTVFNVASDKLSASVTITPNGNFTINANAYKIKTFVNVTYNLANCVSSLTGGTVEKGKEITVTLTANNGFSFSGVAPTVDYETTGTPSTVFNVASDKLSASVTITPNGNFTINANAYKIKTFVNVTYNLANCVSSLTGGTVEKGKEITVTVTANENAQFDGITPNVYYLEHGIPKTVNFTLDTEKKTGTLTFTPNFNFTLNAEANVIKPVAKNYGAINVYKVSLESLDAFSRKRFSKVVDETTGTTQTVNLGVYVNRIKRIFANVPVSGTDNLKCGNYDTKIVVESPKTDILTIDFGNVELTGANGNNEDFNAQVEMFIPCRGVVSIDSKYIGKTINLTMKVNVITGDAVAFISCDGVSFQFESFSLSRDVIYRTGDNDLNIVGGDKWNEEILYGLEPYVLITENLTVDVPVNDTQENVTINEVTGFAQFANVNLNTANLLVDEYDEIISQLETGVYL